MSELSNDSMSEVAKAWHTQGKLNQEVQAVCRYSDGFEDSTYREIWTNKDGQNHRTDGPAVITSRNYQITGERHPDWDSAEYWLNGVRVSEKEMKTAGSSTERKRNNRASSQR